MATMGAHHSTMGVTAVQGAQEEKEGRAGGATTRTRVAAALGLLSLFGTFGGLFIHGYPAIGAPATDIARWALITNPQRFALGLYLEALGSLLFLVFAAWLWSIAHAAEEGSGWLSTAGFSAAAVNAAAGLIGNGVWWAVLDGGRHGTNPQTLATIRDVAQHIYDLTLPLPGVFLLLTGYVLLRTRVLPRLVGATALLIGMGMVIPPAAQSVSLLYFLWIIAVSVYLLARPRAVAVVRASSGTLVPATVVGTP